MRYRVCGGFSAAAAYFLTSSISGRSCTIRLARLAALSVGDARMPKLSLSNHAHMATLSAVPAVCSKHAAEPPIGPAGTTCALGYIWVRVTIEAAGDVLGRRVPGRVL